MEIPSCNSAELLIKREIKKCQLGLCFPGKQSCDRQRPHTEEMESLLLKYTVKLIKKYSLLLKVVFSVFRWAYHFSRTIRANQFTSASVVTICTQEISKDKRLSDWHLCLYCLHADYFLYHSLEFMTLKWICPTKLQHKDISAVLPWQDCPILPGAQIHFPVAGWHCPPSPQEHSLTQSFP